MPLPWRQRGSLRPSEVAEVTGLSPATIRRQIAAGELRAVHVGKSILVPVREVLKLIGEIESEPKPMRDLSNPVARRVRKRADQIARALRQEHA